MLLGELGDGRGRGLRRRVGPHPHHELLLLLQRNTALHVPGLGVLSQPDTSSGPLRRSAGHALRPVEGAFLPSPRLLSLLVPALLPSSPRREGGGILLLLEHRRVHLLRDRGVLPLCRDLPGVTVVVQRTVAFGEPVFVVDVRFTFICGNAQKNKTFVILRCSVFVIQPMHCFRHAFRP